MRSPWYEGLPVEAKQVLEDAEALRRRLERMLHALALGSELAADVLRSAALSGDCGEGKADRLLVLSRRSEEQAQFYRGVESQMSRYRP